jgi:YHS domain-containing protein
MANEIETSSFDDGRVTTVRDEHLEEEPQPIAQATDPVCGMAIDPSGSKTEHAELDGRVYFFCSSACRQTFEEDPRHYAL